MTYIEGLALAKKHSAFPILIDGPHGPTGKSTLCMMLRREGIEAYEQWEFDEGIAERRNCPYLLLYIDKPIS